MGGGVLADGGTAGVVPESLVVLGVVPRVVEQREVAARHDARRDGMFDESRAAVGRIRTHTAAQPRNPAAVELLSDGV